MQAAMFIWFGVLHKRLRFRFRLSFWHVTAGSLVAYALVYPLVGLIDGLRFPRMPIFGVPCPTTILTIGLLLTAERPTVMIAVVWANQPDPRPR